MRNLWRSAECFNYYLKHLTKHTSYRRNFSLSCKMSSVNFGLCFDIDGVIARGYVPFKESSDAFSLLRTNKKLNVPVTFVTNGMGLHNQKADQLSSWVSVQIEPDQCILCQSPLQFYDDFKKKHCLLIGQGPLREIGAELGFENVSLIEEVSAAYPLLDVALFEKKNEIVYVENHVDIDFPKVEAIVILGEPGHWETPLQLVIDLVLTNGKPVSGNTRQHKQTLPVIACNKDFQYMHRSTHPRFGNGTFLLCLETVFQKLTGEELEYSALVGKPSETTMRYAEHRLSEQAAKLGIQQPLRTMYMIGDNINSDITAANLYHRFVNKSNAPSTENAIPLSRQLPSYHPILPQTVQNVRGVLVRTGVYTEGQGTDVDHSHRDFQFENLAELEKPVVVVDNVLHAVEYILEQEKYSRNS